MSTIMRPTIPPEEVLAPPGRDEDYVAWRAQTDLRAPYRVAPEFLKGTKKDAAYDLDDCPLIVFINARSGGRVGPELANKLARALGRSQVFDLAHHRPDTVLQQIWQNFDTQEQLGNARATVVRQRMRILACGGDGTVAWILKVVHQLKLQPPPAVAIMPLGTGNDLSRSFKWGAEFEWNWIKGHASIYSTLKRVSDAQITDLDCWRLRLLLPDASYQPQKTYALTEQPRHHHHQQQQPDQLSHHIDVVARPAMTNAVLLEGMFWNYFSVGADAQAAYNFHHLRDTHPALASNRLANQFWYSAFSCTSGWFCGTLQSVSRFSSIQVQQPGSGGAWSPLVIPSSIKALVLVNLQSYAGGRNIWGESESKKKKWRKPSVADGLIEVVGFTHGYHALAVMSSGAKLAHGKRLAQVHAIRLELRQPMAEADGGPGEVFMQLDGEPWLQKVPAGGREGTGLVLEIIHAGVSKVLCNSGEPAAHPVKKVTHMLSEEQAEAYLAAKASAGDLQAVTSAVELQHHTGSSEDTDVPTADHSSLHEACAEPQQALGFSPAPPSVNCAGTVPAGLVSSSGSVSDPGTIQSTSGSGGRVFGAARMSAEPGVSSTDGDVACQQVRYAISQPGTPPAAFSSSMPGSVGDASSRLYAASAHKQHGYTPSAVAVIEPLKTPCSEAAAQQKQQSGDVCFAATGGNQSCAGF